MSATAPSPVTPTGLARLRRTPFWVQIVAGLVLGVVLGFIARQNDVSWLSTTLDTVGRTFVQLLKLAVPPLVFTAIVVSIANLRNVTNAARLAVRTLLWFGITSLIAVSIGLAIGLLTDPGQGTNLSTTGLKAPADSGSWVDFLTGIIPTNIADAFLKVNVLQIVFLAVVAGAAILKAA